MKTKVVKRETLPKILRGDSANEYDKIVEGLLKTKVGEVVEISCERRKPATVFCGVRKRLILRGVYSQFTSIINEDRLYLTRRTKC